MHDLFKIDNHTHFLELWWYRDQLIIGTVSKIMHELLKWLEKDKCKRLWKGLLVTYVYMFKSKTKQKHSVTKVQL